MFKLRNKLKHKLKFWLTLTSPTATVNKTLH